MGVVIKLGICKGTGMECNGVNFTIRINRRDNASQGIVQSVGFDDDRSVRRPMGEDRCLGESRLERLECRLCFQIPIPCNDLQVSWCTQVRVRLSKTE